MVPPPPPERGPVWGRPKNVSRTACLILAICLCAIGCAREGKIAPGRGSDAGCEWQTIPRLRNYNEGELFAVDGGVLLVAGPDIHRLDLGDRKWTHLKHLRQTDQCEGCGTGHATVWTGRELIMWGGGFHFDGKRTDSRGVRFDPSSGRLRPLPPAPIAPRWWHTAVWTGEEVIVWGGARGRHELGTGAAYAPGTNTWRMIPSAPMTSNGHTAIWSGTEMIVWGGSDDHESEGTEGFPSRFLNAGAAYDPRADRWRSIPDAPLKGRAWHSGVWTGKRMIVWGGVGGRCRPHCTLPADGGAYDPVADSWEIVRDAPISGRMDHRAVWTGREMIVWGGSPAGGGYGFDDGATYAPETGRWAELPSAPIGGRYRHAAAWAGVRMIVWGGCCLRSKNFQRSFFSGAAYRPE